MIKVIERLRRIIKEMANFRDMRNLVKILDDMNTQRVNTYKKEHNIGEISDNQELEASATKEKTIRVYTNFLSGDEEKARKVYRDCTSKKYAYIREKKNKSIVTSAGGELILERFGTPYTAKLPTGMWREATEKNYLILSLIVAFIAGIVLGVLAL